VQSKSPLPEPGPTYPTGSPSLGAIDAGIDVAFNLAIEGDVPDHLPNIDIPDLDIDVIMEPEAPICVPSPNRQGRTGPSQRPAQWYEECGVWDFLHDKGKEVSLSEAENDNGSDWNWCSGTEDDAESTGNEQLFETLDDEELKLEDWDEDGLLTEPWSQGLTAVEILEEEFACELAISGMPTASFSILVELK
jgi:hypothetical protein